MSKQMNLEELHKLSLQELQQLMEQGQQAKARLEAQKSKGGKAWTQEMQDELDNTVLGLVDLEEYIEERKKQEETTQESTESTAYVPAKGAEKMVHLAIVHGRRFNPNTGKEESKPYIQLFTFGEWQLFKQNYKMLGFSIVKVLHDPYNEAEVTKL